MPKETVKLLIDENVDVRLASELRKKGIDVVNVQEIGRRSIDDESLLEYAFSEKRVLITHNIRHFTALHKKFHKGNKKHFGIILAKDIYIGTLLKRILPLIRNREKLSK